GYQPHPCRPRRGRKAARTDTERGMIRAVSGFCIWLSALVGWGRVEIAQAPTPARARTRSRTRIRWIGSTNACPTVEIHQFGIGIGFGLRLGLRFRRWPLNG